MIFQILFYILSYDIWFYISHLILHTKYVYKLIHLQHHMKNHQLLSYQDTYVGHFIEGPFQGLGVFFPLCFIDFEMSSFVVSIIIINVRGMARHENRLIWLIGNHHLLHHKYPKSNYGEYWLDYLLGTNNANTDEYQMGLVYM